MGAKTRMSYHISSDFEYHVHRRPPFLFRIRRSFWHFYRDSRTTAVMVLLAVLVGLILFMGLNGYVNYLDLGHRAAIDAEHRRAVELKQRRDEERGVFR